MTMDCCCHFILVKILTSILFFITATFLNLFYLELFKTKGNRTNDNNNNNNSINYNSLIFNFLLILPCEEVLLIFHLFLLTPFFIFSFLLISGNNLFPFYFLPTTSFICPKFLCYSISFALCYI